MRRARVVGFRWPTQPVSVDLPPVRSRMPRRWRSRPVTRGPVPQVQPAQVVLVVRAAVERLAAAVRAAVERPAPVELVAAVPEVVARLVPEAAVLRVVALAAVVPELVVARLVVLVAVARAVVLEPVAVARPAVLEPAAVPEPAVPGRAVSTPQSSGR